MKIIDTHVHTDFSSDGVEKAEDMIRAAIRKGIQYIAFTDHLDLGRDGCASERMRDLKAVLNCFCTYKARYAGQIEIAAGVEVGFAPEHEAKLTALLDGLNFDYVINSIHDVNGQDCYRMEFYKNKTKQQAFTEYFDAVLQSLDASFTYHALGHLCYVERVAPYPDRRACYNQFADILDKILNKLIKKGKLLELNSSIRPQLSESLTADCGTLRTKAPAVCLPGADILARYKQLGGTRVTFGSDAHQIPRLLDKYDAVTDLCKQLGFSGFTYISSGKEKLAAF
ncbi:MAG: histidinol-phosphatase HisJ family protein [Firmicutes bacterium]|nr:histidinol-phosphatase HisJ family protein [Bacillota bacterium]